MATNGYKLSMRDTTTSVELFFNKIDTIGIKYYPASSGLSFSAILQTAWAMLPLTCWLLSVVNYSFNPGRTF